MQTIFAIALIVGIFAVLLQVMGIIERSRLWEAGFLVVWVSLAFFTIDKYYLTPPVPRWQALLAHLLVCALFIYRYSQGAFKKIRKRRRGVIMR